jgi:hypothetical protein
VRALEGRHRPEIDLRKFPPVLHVAQDALQRGESILQPSDNRHPVNRRPLNCVGDVGAPFVIDADERRIAAILLSEHSRLDGGVILHGAVPVEVVRRDVDQNAGVGLEARHQVDLER